jgi:hypothetical protein
MAFAFVAGIAANILLILILTNATKARASHIRIWKNAISAGNA